MLHKVDYRLQVINIQIDVLLTLSTTFTLTPPQQLFNVETHETTKKIMTSVKFHGTTLLLNIIIHHLKTKKWKNISRSLKSSTRFFTAMFRQTGSSLGAPDKEFVGREIAIKDGELEPRVWKYFIFSHHCFKTLYTQDLA